MRILRRRGPWIMVAVLAMTTACAGAAPVPPTGISNVEPQPAVESSAGGTSLPAGEPIRIGGTLGLTGAFAEPAAAAMAAYEHWAAEVNAGGGLLGRPVELMVYDDVSDPGTARDLYRRLIDQDQVDLLLAPYGADIGAAVLPLAERNEMVLFSGGFTGVEMFRGSDWMVGATTYQEPDVARGVFELIDTLPPRSRPRRIGIATARDPFTLRVRDGADGRGGVVTLAAERGMAVVLNEEYATGTSDVIRIVDEARARNVDLFFALSQPADAALLARTAHSVGFAPGIYCACGAQVTSLPSWRELGPAGDGVLAPAIAWPTDDFPALAGLSEHARSALRYPELPVALTAGYVILQVLQQAVEEVGMLDQAALRDWVTGRTIDTVVGPISYDADGVPRYAALVVQDQGDANQVVWPADHATAAARIPRQR